jgi:DinB superfamily
MTRSRLRERVTAAWAGLEASYAGLSDAALLEPGASGTWSVRDVLAHVTTWEEEALRHLPVILVGGRPPRYSVTYGGIDAFNARATAAKRGLSLARVREQAARTHRRLMDYLERVPEAALRRESRFRRRLRLDTYGHYAIHAEGIRHWRRRRAASGP